MSQDFFSEDFINDAQKEILENEAKFGGDKREKMSAGVHDLILCKVESDTTDDGVPMVKLIYNKEEDQKTFRDMNKTFKFDSSDQEKLLVVQKMFFQHFYKGFGYTFKRGTLKDVINQIKKFEKKKLRAAVVIRQSIMKKYTKDAEGKNTNDVYGVMVIDRPEISYVGQITEDMKLAPEKRFKKLSTTELEVYEDHKNEFPDRYNEDGSLKFEDGNSDSTASSSSSSEDPITGETKSTTATTGEVDDLPW